MKSCAPAPRRATASTTRGAASTSPRRVSRQSRKNSSAHPHSHGCASMPRITGSPFPFRAAIATGLRTSLGTGAGMRARHVAGFDQTTERSSAGLESAHRGLACSLGGCPLTSRAASVIGNRCCYRKQLRSACFGGQGTSPYEQNTQQSPGSGFSTVPQDGQSQKNWQASVGMDVRVAVPHSGHVIVLSSTGVRRDLSNGLSAMIK